ncbi:hypothetical protein F5146DRAFT_1006373 [Armillaria mellea]|nr:hypothetical protein F5146DRAFT_1006373 [Armillaria mellea]
MSATNTGQNEVPMYEDLLKSMQDLQLQNWLLDQQNQELHVAVITLLTSSVDAENSLSIVNTGVHTSVPAPRQSLLSSDDARELRSYAKQLVALVHLFWEKKEVFGIKRMAALLELESCVTQLAQLIDEQEKLKLINQHVEDFGGWRKLLETRITLLRVVKGVFEILPERFHSMAENNYRDFVDLMEKGGSNGRSALIFPLRKVSTAFKIFEDVGVPIEKLFPEYDRSTDEQCLSLLGYDPVKKIFPSAPPVLYSIGHAKKADPDFILKGAQSSILYERDADFYIQTITNTCLKESTQRTVTFFNQNLFSLNKPKLDAVTTHVADESDLAKEKILQGLDEVESDSSNDCEDTDEAGVNTVAEGEGSSGGNVNLFHSGIPPDPFDDFASGPAVDISALDQQNNTFQSNIGSLASRHQQKEPTVALEIQPAVPINHQDSPSLQCMKLQNCRDGGVEVERVVGLAAVTVAGAVEKAMEQKLMDPLNLTLIIWFQSQASDIISIPAIMNFKKF